MARVVRLAALGAVLAAGDRSSAARTTRFPRSSTPRRRSRCGGRSRRSSGSTRTRGSTSKSRRADGKAETWMVEGGTPNTLQRGGITRDSIKIGTVIVVAGFKAKDGRLRANGRDITFPDGRTLFMGSSGTGAPKRRPRPERARSRGSDAGAPRPDASRVRRVVVAGVSSPPVSACAGQRQPQAYRAPRTADGTPDLNGIWQANNTANWDIQAHAARQGPVFALGAAFSVPPGLGVVEGDEIPVPAGGAGEEAGQRRQLDDARSRGQVLHAGRAARHLHAVSLSDRAVGRQRPDDLRVRQRQPHRAHEQPGEEPGAGVDGMVARPLGRRDAGRRRDRPHGRDVVRSRRQLPQRRAEGDRALHRDRRQHAAVRGDDRGSEGVLAAVEDEHAALPAARAERAADGIQVRASSPKS